MRWGLLEALATEDLRSEDGAPDGWRSSIEMAKDGTGCYSRKDQAATAELWEPVLQSSSSWKQSVMGKREGGE